MSHTRVFRNVLLGSSNHAKGGMSLDDVTYRCIPPIGRLHSFIQFHPLGNLDRDIWIQYQRFHLLSHIFDDFFGIHPGITYGRLGTASIVSGGDHDGGGPNDHYSQSLLGRAVGFFLVYKKR